MTDLLFKLAGLEMSADDRVTGVDFALQPNLAPWLLGAVLAVLAVITWLLYRRSPSDVRAGRRWWMTTLRVAFFAVLLALLLRPILGVHLERDSLRRLPVLIDSSASMSLADPGQPARIERVKQALADNLPALDKRFEVELHQFGNMLTKLARTDLPRLVADAPETALGKALTDIAANSGGAPLAGIVILTDGVNTLPPAPGVAAQAYGERGVPLFTCGVGSADAYDLAVEALEVAEAALVEDLVPVTVRLRTQGMAGQNVNVVLKLAGVPVDEKRVTVQGDGEIVVPLQFLPQRAGDYPLEASIEPASGELLADNNAATRQLRVLDSKIRVLMVDQAPRWDYKYIQTMLLREKRVALDCFLFEQDAEVARGTSSPYLPQFPGRPEELFRYDLILFGDIDPKLFATAQIDALRRFVAEAGGSMIFLAGKRFMPQAWRHTAVEQLLPIELGPASVSIRDTTATRPIMLKPTPSGADSPMLQLADDPDASRALWNRLPPIYWTAAVRRAKPAATVLAVHPEADRPILALHRYGAGEVLFVGTDNTWRWRKNTGAEHHTRFWGQIVQRMAGGQLLRGSRRTRLQASQSAYRPGERVTVHARLHDRAWDNRTEARIAATLQSTDANTPERPVWLSAIPEKPGQYRTEFTAPDAGRYRLVLQDDPESPLELTVRTPSSEFARAAMNAPLLGELATATGGAFSALDSLDQLLAAIPSNPTTHAFSKDLELWASPLVFVLLVALLAAEWVFRKYAELK